MFARDVLQLTKPRQVKLGFSGLGTMTGDAILLDQRFDLFAELAIERLQRRVVSDSVETSEYQ